MNGRTIDQSLPTQDIMGIRFVATTFAHTMGTLTAHIDSGDKIRVITANPEIVMHARRDPTLAHILNDVDYVTPDGVGILIAGKILKQPIPERITGVELTTALLAYADAQQLRVYLVGATPDVMASADARIRAQYPRIDLRTHHGYFDTKTEQDILADIRSHTPHILLVGLGAPRQELWLSTHRDHLHYNVAIAVGGVFDVLAGKVRRAPLLWQRLGLEWLYRLIQQPRRIGRMLALPTFILTVLHKRIWGTGIK